jgi:hypothetical protein
VVSATASNVGPIVPSSKTFQHNTTVHSSNAGVVETSETHSFSRRQLAQPSGAYAPELLTAFEAESASQAALSRQLSSRTSVASGSQTNTVQRIARDGEPSVAISVDIIHSDQADLAGPMQNTQSAAASHANSGTRRSHTGSLGSAQRTPTSDANTTAELSMVAMAAALASTMATNGPVLVEAHDETMSVQVQAANKMVTSVTPMAIHPNNDTTLALPDHSSAVTRDAALEPEHSAGDQAHSLYDSDETADDDARLDEIGDDMAMDGPSIRQLQLVVGPTRPNRLTNLYLPEDVFIDPTLGATVQPRGEGYQTAQPTSAAVYDKRRRNSLDSEHDSCVEVAQTDFAYSSPYARNYDAAQPPPRHPYMNNEPRGNQPSYTPVSPDIVTVDMPRPQAGPSYRTIAGAPQSPHDLSKKFHDTKKKAERPPELIGARDFRRGLCSLLIAPFLCCWPFDRTMREARAFFAYYIICNIGFFLAIVLAPETPTPWVIAVLAIPTVMAIIRFSAAVLARVAGVKIEYSLAMKGHVVMMVPCYTEDREGLEATLDSMAASDLRGLTGTIVAICDGRVIGVGSTESCEECLTSMMSVTRTTVYKDYTEYAGTYKGMAMYVVGKHQNAGKRDSQIRVFNLVNQGRFGQVDYIFMTDAVSVCVCLRACVCMCLRVCVYLYVCVFVSARVSGACGCFFPVPVVRLLCLSVCIGVHLCHAHSLLWSIDRSPEIFTGLLLPTELCLRAVLAPLR